MQRRQLIGMLKLLVIVGLGLLLIPFLKSCGPTGAPTDSAAARVFDVSGIPPGQYLAVDVAGRQIWIYRWSAEDRQRQAVQDERQSWSVLIPYEPHRGCRVHLREDMHQAVRFVEPCFSAGFDVSGRRLAGTGVAAQQDLPSLAFTWQNSHQMRLQLGTR